jgi:hypothetical protein
LADDKSASCVVRDALWNIPNSGGSLKFKEESSKENELLFRCSGYQILNGGTSTTLFLFTTVMNILNNNLLFFRVD